MKHQFVNTLQEGDTVNDYFVATRKDLRTQRNGNPFLGMVFKDRSGEVGGILWNNAADIDKRFELGDVVTVRGRVQSYQGNLQIQVDSVLPLRDGEFDPEDLVLVPEAAKAAGEKFVAMLAAIEHPHLAQLVRALLDDGPFMQRFAVAAAAKRWHHAYRGGLAQHCYEMACLAEAASALFPRANKDLLLVGIFLHDIGKLDELSQDLFVDYTTEGKLLGHIHLGAHLAEQHIAAIPGFPPELRQHLLHLILSHHGEVELGSPVTPKTIEAILLHHIDNLDAQASAFERIIEETQANRRVWSDYQPLIQREVYARDA